MKFLKRSLCVLLIVIMSANIIYAHSGRTDGSGGHKDNKNASGLGSYHYHCGGYSAHLHPNGFCPYTTPDDTISVTKPAVISVGYTHDLVFELTTTIGGNSVSWTSNNDDIMSVDKNGRITAKADGTVTITGTSKNGSTSFTATAATIQVTEISLSKTDIDATKGDKIAITPTIVPENASDKSITWTTDDKNIAYIENNVIYAVGKGVATLTAKTLNGVSATISVSVKLPEPTSIKIIYDNSVISNNCIYIDTALSVDVSILPEDADEQTIEWDISNPDVAKMEGNNIIFLSAGDVEISAKTSNGLTDTLKLKVVDVPVETTKNEKAFSEPDKSENDTTETETEETNIGDTIVGAGVVLAIVGGIHHVRKSKNNRKK